MKTIIKLINDVQAGSSQSQIIPSGSMVEITDMSGYLPMIIGISTETGVEHHIPVGWQDIFGPESHVQAGDGEDYDTGTVDSTTPTHAVVRWDSGVTTTTPIYTLRPLSFGRVEIVEDESE